MEYNFFEKASSRQAVDRTPADRTSKSTGPRVGHRPKRGSPKGPGMLPSPQLDPAFRQDIEELVALAERLYHLPGGKNGNGAFGRLCKRVHARLEVKP